MQRGRLALLFGRRRSCNTLKRHSHIGSASISLPPEVNIVSRPTVHQQATVVTGPKGKIQLSVPAFVSLRSSKTSESSEEIIVQVDKPQLKFQREHWGLTRTLLFNAVTGVSVGHELLISLKGVGYRASLDAGGILNLKLGFPLPILKKVPDGVECVLKSQTEIVVRGIDKQALGQFASDIRSYRKPEPYNGKVGSIFSCLASQLNSDANATGYLCGIRNYQAQRSQEEIGKR